MQHRQHLTEKTKLHPHLAQHARLSWSILVVSNCGLTKQFLLGDRALINEDYNRLCSATSPKTPLNLQDKPDCCLGMPELVA